jgi:organic hydroperoxide reductase OsmC/OhrA
MMAGRLFSQIPAIGFEENKGQYPKEILYASRAGAYVTSTAFVLAQMQASMQFENASPGVQPLPGDALAG